MTNLPKVSVIIAVYNMGIYIDQCMESLLNQTYRNFEIIICDDASTDNTAEILNKYRDKAIIITNKENERAAKSRNNCIERATGEFLMIQDSDDYSSPERMEKLVKTLLDEPSISFVSSGYCIFNENGIVNQIKPKKEYPNKWRFLYGIPHCHPATMFRKECFVAVEGYRVSKETRRGQDYDLFARLYARGYRGKNSSETLYFYRVDKNTIARRTLEYRMDAVRLAHKAFKELHLYPLGCLFLFKPILGYFYQYIRKDNR